MYHRRRLSEGPTGCGDGEQDPCFNKEVATRLRITAIFVILGASLLGVFLPLAGQRFGIFKSNGTAIFMAKSFAAGVILAVAFVHIFPEAIDKLTSPCLPEHPWGKFPWTGFIALMGVLLTQLVDFGATQLITKLSNRHPGLNRHHHTHDDLLDNEVGAMARTRAKPAEATKEGEVEEGTSSPMPIMSLHVHAASHGQGEGPLGLDIHADGHNSHRDRLRHVIIAQVMELGIGLHSVLIGVGLGASTSPCTIRPLLTALVFHQFFEGVALGGCISEARFKDVTSISMAAVFAITTPTGIALGLGIASSYKPNSTTSLITEGTLDAVACGVLIYLALVDIIAHDFLSAKMGSSRKLQVLCYLALFLGAGSMSLLAVWA